MARPPPPIYAPPPPRPEELPPPGPPIEAPPSLPTYPLPPTPTPHEVEPADVQATLSVRQVEVRVGEILDIDLDIVNASDKGPVTLVRIEELIPHGFQIVDEPRPFRVVGRGIDLRGKVLVPLKAVEIYVRLMPTTKGVFTLKPGILYLDEKGVLKLSELNATTIVVKEMGLLDWMRGRS